MTFIHLIRLPGSAALTNIVPAFSTHALIQMYIILKAGNPVQRCWFGWDASQRACGIFDSCCSCRKCQDHRRDINCHSPGVRKRFYLYRSVGRCPQKFSIHTAKGVREFRFGARAANPIDQWPDPLVFLHIPPDSNYPVMETRNLNRAYPGRADGTPTEETAAAIMALIEKQHVDIAVDLHEAAPEIPIINALVTHPKKPRYCRCCCLESRI